MRNFEKNTEFLIAKYYFDIMNRIYIRHLKNIIINNPYCTSISPSMTDMSFIFKNDSTQEDKESIKKELLNIAKSNKKYLEIDYDENYFYIKYSIIVRTKIAVLKKVRKD